MAKFKVKDRVRYYGVYNDLAEVTTATVDVIGPTGLIKVVLDSYCDDSGDMVPEMLPQWAHPKQLRKLKTKGTRNV